MATNTPNLNIPKPDGNEYFNRTQFNAILDVIDLNAATKQEVQDAVGNIDLSKLATKEEVNTVDSALTSHKNDYLPHKFIDGATTYRYGFSVINGVLTFNYEEVV
ncbi:hypothetical protein [Bacillus massiliigorillae]|uniref:hypothetical protein n=1 Tax=Bacillus massiliigorillae TaxID=1243664 RepID=UPI0003A58EE2|nr:hypothetical protein [Bacillus massiliigorillae]